MSMMNHKVDPLNEERSVIDNLIASSQNLMGSSSSPVSQQNHTLSDYQTTVSKSKMMLKSRRGRTSFTPGQLSDLETAFANTHYPDFQTRKDLSSRLKIPDDRIQVWFQNRRAKWRKTQRQINGGPVVMNLYRSSQTTGSSSNNIPQTHERPVSEIPLCYNLSRPSSIKHTGSFTHNSVSQGNVTDSKSEQRAYQGQQQNLGNVLSMYEKSKVPHTAAETSSGIPDNQRTAPSLYSLSAAVTSSGQYIVLGPSTNPPSTYPMTVSCNSYPVQIPSQNSKY